ncbi:hypothetical protein GF406_13010 [candidate division KSB1 bacterium]|nr:hypothetical protein [candidate division KSB1 bacterium]
MCSLTCLTKDPAPDHVVRHFFTVIGAAGGGLVGWIAGASAKGYTGAPFLQPGTGEKLI